MYEHKYFRDEHKYFQAKSDWQQNSNKDEHKKIQTDPN